MLPPSKATYKRLQRFQFYPLYQFRAGGRSSLPRSFWNFLGLLHAAEAGVASIAELRRTCRPRLWPLTKSGIRVLPAGLVLSFALKACTAWAVRRMSFSCWRPPSAHYLLVGSPLLCKKSGASFCVPDCAMTSLHASHASEI